MQLKTKQNTETPAIVETRPHKQKCQRWMNKPNKMKRQPNQTKPNQTQSSQEGRIKK